MSLINEALKKAQRLHADNSAAQSAASGADTATPIAKRNPPKSPRTLLLLGAGAVVLVVVSVVLTVFWLNRPTPKPAVASAKPAAVDNAAPIAAPAAPVIVAPIVATPPAAIEKRETNAAEKPATPRETPPASATVVAPVKSSPAATLAAETPSSPEPATPASAPSAAPAPATPPPTSTSKSAAASAPAKPDERVHQFVEALRVGGIRSSGTDSRVLMNDRVYRVNDIVDRTLNIRLTNVSADSLTFTDGNGVTYVKYF